MKTKFDELEELIGVKHNPAKKKTKKRAKKKSTKVKEDAQPIDTQQEETTITAPKSEEEIKAALKEAETILKSGISDVAVQAQLNMMGCNLIEIAGNIAMYGSSESAQLKAVQMLLDRILPVKKSVDSNIRGDVTLKVNVVKSWGDMENVTEV